MLDAMNSAALVARSPRKSLMQREREMAQAILDNPAMKEEIWHEMRRIGTDREWDAALTLAYAEMKRDED